MAEHVNGRKRLLHLALCIVKGIQGVERPLCKRVTEFNELQDSANLGDGEAGSALRQGHLRSRAFNAENNVFAFFLCCRMCSYRY